MATIIEAQLLTLIEQVERVTWNLQGLGRIGTAISAAQHPEDFYNLLELLTEIQSDKLDELTSYLKANLLTGKEQG